MKRGKLSILIHGVFRRQRDDALTIRDIKRVHLNPGDDLLVRTERISPEARDLIKRQLQGLWPNNRIVFVEAGVEIEVLEASGASIAEARRLLADIVDAELGPRLPGGNPVF